MEIMEIMEPKYSIAQKFLVICAHGSNEVKEICFRNSLANFIFQFCFLSIFTIFVSVCDSLELL